MDTTAASSPTAGPAAPHRVGGGPHRPTGPMPTSDDVDDLTARLTALERDLRRTWAALVERDAGMAGRVGHAGRLVHRAAAILEPGTIY